MSSLSLSGIEFLLRMTVALPVRVATLPIGSSFELCASVGWAGEGVAGAGTGAGWAWANLIAPDIACMRAGGCPVSRGDGIAKAFDTLAGTRQVRSQTAKQNRCLVTMKS